MPSKTQQSLQQSLARLHTELAAAPRLDPKSRQLLREVLADIERILQQAPAAEPSAVKPAARSAPRLEALAIEFESEHPALAGSLRQLVDLLGRAGL
jgi:predicted component of type VI protein secretion system